MMSYMRSFHHLPGVHPECRELISAQACCTKASLLRKSNRDIGGPLVSQNGGPIYARNQRSVRGSMKRAFSSCSVACGAKSFVSVTFPPNKLATREDTIKESICLMAFCAWELIHMHDIFVDGNCVPRKWSGREIVIECKAFSIDPEDAALNSQIEEQKNVEKDPISEVARQNLGDASNAFRRYGWLAFWGQLVLTTVAAVIILFSMAFTSQAGPQVSLYLTIFSVSMGYLSTFWSFGYTRLSRRLRAFLDAAGDYVTGERQASVSSSPSSPKPPRPVRRSEVIGMLEKGAIINVLGAGASLLALQATIGMLVAKTLTTASVNPFLASSSNSWNPVLAFDVFNVQATTNSLLSHFFSLILSLWILRIVSNRPSAARVMSRIPKPS